MYKIRLVSAEYKRWLFIRTGLLLRQCSLRTALVNVHKAVKNCVSKGLRRLRRNVGCRLDGLKSQWGRGRVPQARGLTEEEKKNHVESREPFNTHLRPPIEASQRPLSRGSPTRSHSTRCSKLYARSSSRGSILLRISMCSS